MKFKGTPVFNPHNPRDLYKQGGYVYSSPHMTQKQLQNDSVLAVLRPNEIVIPVKHAKTVAKFLKSKNIKLPNL